LRTLLLCGKRHAGNSFRASCCTELLLLLLLSFKPPMAPQLLLLRLWLQLAAGHLSRQVEQLCTSTDSWRLQPWLLHAEVPTRSCTLKLTLELLLRAEVPAGACTLKFTAGSVLHAEVPAGPCTSLQEAASLPLLQVLLQQP
jgi:hypothetical protein